MKQKQRVRFILLLLLLTVIWSCQDELDFETQNLEQTETSDDWLKNAKKLENPYSIKNMRIALENIKNREKSKSTASKSSTYAKEIEQIDQLEIEPTHLYVKFEPKNFEEEAILKQDTTRVLFDYPLDYDFTDEELDSRPALGENEVPQYYTAIRIDTDEASEAHYELLEELYIPEEADFFDELDKNLVNKSSKNNWKEGFMEELIKEAYTLTGNEDELEPQKSDTNLQAKWIFGTRWWPSGTLKIWDDNAGASTTTTRVFSHWEYYDCGGTGELPYTQKLTELIKLPIEPCKRAVYKYVTNTVQGEFVPLVGAQVLMRQWFTVRQGITDQNGYFKTSSVRGKARYIIQWERYHYSIRNGSLFQAETRGPKVKKQAWNLNIKGGDDEYHGMIHTAAHIYYYGNRFGLTSPPTNATLKKQMKIAAREQNGTSSHVHQRRFIHLAQIHIKEWGEESQQVFGTTIHELAHAAHWNLDRSAYNNLVWDGYISDVAFNNQNRGDVRTLETWATTVEILFALNRYRDMFNQPNYRYNLENFQFRRISDNNFYTSAGFDMIDNINQRNVYGSAYPIDRVSGYTVKQLEDGLRGAKSWIEWRNNIKAKHNNTTENFVDELFNNWQ